MLLIRKKSILTPKSLNFYYFTTLKKKSSKIWMNEHVNDGYVHRAKLLEYRSRAAFKLLEIHQRYDILKEGYKVIDLGSAPGSWTQVAVDYVKSPKDAPNVLAVDKIDMSKVPGSKFILGDINDETVRLEISENFDMKPVDVILSDMAPNFDGDKDSDHMAIASLNMLVVRLCFNNLNIGGTMLMKTLQGTLEGNFYKLYSVFFKNFLRVKPNASRSRSSELFYLGKGFKLGEKYLKNKKFYDRFNSKNPLEFDPEEIQGLAMKEDFESYLKQKAQEQLELGIDLKKDNLKQYAKFGIDIEAMKETVKPKYNDLKNGEDQEELIKVIKK